MAIYCDLEQKVVRETVNTDQFLVIRHYLVLNFNGTKIGVPVTKKEYDASVIGTIYKVVEDKR